MKKTLLNKKRREIVKERFDEVFRSAGYDWKAGTKSERTIYYRKEDGRTDMCLLSFSFSGAVEIEVSERLVLLDEIEEIVERMYPDIKCYTDARKFYFADLYEPTLRDTSLGNKEYGCWFLPVRSRFSTLSAIELFCENYFTYYFETAAEEIENYVILPRLLLRLEEFHDEIPGRELCPLYGMQADLVELIISRLCGDPNYTKLLREYETRRNTSKDKQYLRYVWKFPSLDRVRSVLESVRPAYSVLN